jgi:DNA helicase-2/ATP-dependent DNA helicase PcrA
MDATGQSLAGLNEAQAYAVGLGSGPTLVIAGAGTGKTRTLVHRVAYLVEKGVSPSAILLLTFTRRAAAEMLGRARELNPACGAVEGGTFHSVAHRLLRRYASHIDLPRSFTIIDPADQAQIIKGAVDELGLKEKGDKRFPRAGSIASVISKARNLELNLEDTLEQHYTHWMPLLERLEAAARAYAQAKKGQFLLDYDDLLYMCEELLKRNPLLRQELHGQWRHLLVDEYQDTNAVQARLLELLCGPGKDLMVVGDDAQSIYAFRGARLRNILDFPQQFANTRVVKLTQNYRSTQPILDLSNQIIAQAAERYEKDLFTEQSGGPAPELCRPREQKEQSRELVRRIKELLLQGSRPEDIAVLFRAGRDSFDLEGELKAERIPFVKYGGIRFVELAHIKDVMCHLRVVGNPNDFLSWQRLLMLVPGVGPKTAQSLIAHMVAGANQAEYASRLASAPQAQKRPELAELSALVHKISQPPHEPLEMLEAVMAYYEPICKENYPDYPRRLKDLEELPGLAAVGQSLDEFLAETVLDPPDSQAGGPEGHPVTLSTTHSAKGQEWKHVFVIWACDGHFPTFPALDDPNAVEEERRLFYVACTRAAQTLHIFSPREQYFQGSGWRFMDLSRFVSELPEGLLARSQGDRVFDVPEPSPSSRGSQYQTRPIPVGTVVMHATFGQGKIMGYKGEKKVLVYFQRLGLKTLMLEFANLEVV